MEALESLHNQDCNMTPLIILTIFLLVLLCSKALHPTTRTGTTSSRYRYNSGPLQAIDVSGLPVDPGYSTGSGFEEFAIQSLGLTGSSEVTDLQNLLILVSAAAYVLYEKRPLGSCNDNLVEMRKSTIPGAGVGLFAKEVIPEGVVIGEFPGYVKNVDMAIRSKKDDKARNAAKRYMWALSEDTVLDPTNEFGEIDVSLAYLGGLVKADTKIARINEPPQGKDCNVYARMKGPIVEVVTERAIYPDNDEIFIDYGKAYDRSEYMNNEDGGDEFNLKALREQQRLEAENIREKEDMMTLQPIRADTDVENSDVAPEDTTVSDGFIAKLKKEESKLDKSGVINPKDAAKQFSELGSTMFGGDEDRELIESLMGKSSSDDKPPRKPKGIISPEDADRMLGTPTGMGQDMFESLYGKGASNVAKKDSMDESSRKITNSDNKSGILDEEDAMKMFGGGDSSSKQDDEIMAGLQAQLGSAGDEQFEDDSSGSGSSSSRSSSDEE